MWRKTCPRDRTLIIMFGGSQGQFADVNLGNPYATGASHQIGNAAMWEPLYFYSAFADEHIPWLAESYEYNADFTELTIKIRSGVEWSDGTPFTAKDVAFTLNMLMKNGLDPDAAKIRNSTEVSKWVQEATAVDDATVKIVFFDPRPRFMFSHLSSKFDTGIYLVPEHIYKDVEDVSAYQGYDPEAGLPLGTGPYKITAWTPQQKFIDRRDDWWAVKTGFVAELPAVERILSLPTADETTMAQMVINNELDSSARSARDHNPPGGGSEREDHHPHGQGSAAGLHRLVADFVLVQLRRRRLCRQECALGRQLHDRSPTDARRGARRFRHSDQLPFPQYAGLQPFFEAAAPLLEKYNTAEHNLDKAAERMAAAGYEKDGEGFWVKDGARISDIIGGWGIFADIGPVLAEQLRQGWL